MNKNGPGTLDWSEELSKSDDDYQHIPTALWAADQHGGGKVGVDPLNKAEKLIKNGEKPESLTDAQISEYIMRNAPKQPTDEEMFGHLVVTEEMAKKVQDDWDNSMNKSLTHPKIGDKEEVEWGTGESFNDSLSDKERLKRNMYTGD